jgi:ActR/RegA family two-component response regulator
MPAQNPLPLTMLIIDDSTPYVESLFRDAQRHAIRLLHAGSLEEGRELFAGKQGRGIAGIILDGKCLKEKAQQVPDSSFLGAAIKYFGEKAPHLPLVVLTGETELYRNLSDLYAGTVRVYSKGHDEKEMLAHLLHEAQQLEWLKTVRQYGDVFAGLSRRLGEDAEQELVSALMHMKSDDPTVIRNTLICLRRLQEKIFIALQKSDAGLIPAHLVTGEVNVVGIYKHLAERGAIERYKVVDRFCELVYKVTSDNGAHTPYENPKYPPTKYTVQAVTFALLDLILWFKSTVR